MNPSDAIIDDLLPEANSLLLGLFSNELIGVYVIQDGLFIYANTRLADMFGYRQDELCNRLGPMDLIAVDDHAKAKHEISRRIRGEISTSFYGFRGVRKDGSTLDAEVFGVSTRHAGKPAIIGIMLNVSERISAEKAAADQLRFIGQLVETIPNPVFYKDEAGRYLGCNAAFEQFIGLHRSQLIGRSVYDISPKELADKYHAADQVLFDNPGTQTYEASVAGSDNQRRDVIFYKATFNKADGALGGLVGVILDISERKQLEETIWHQANYDALTGLPNRRLFRDRLSEEVKRTQRHGSTLALLFIDLDRFKEVNDIHGHDVGDCLLIQAAERIQSSVRASDTVSRQGGDEFIVILPDIQNSHAAGRIAQTIINKLSSPFDLDGHQAYISASIGIAFYPEDSQVIELLISFADQAMYAAKESGRSGFCYFTSSMQNDAMRRVELGNDLRGALTAQQFEVHYQPIIDLANGRIVKAEALLRWQHPRRGMVSPAEFIPLAEDLGVIDEIGQWVFEQAMNTARQWQADDAGTQVQISVNVSPLQFLTGDCNEWIKYPDQHGLPSESLSLEITEGMLLDDRPAVVSALHALRDAGIQISIDDFGTGYSAMAYLKKFKIDYLKIDRSLVSDIATNETDLAIAEAITVMAHKLGIKVIAEGIETLEQCKLLSQAGCDFAQGYLFARPMPQNEFRVFAAKICAEPDAMMSLIKTGPEWEI